MNKSSHRTRSVDHVPHWQCTKKRFLMVSVNRRNNYSNQNLFVRVFTREPAFCFKPLFQGAEGMTKIPPRVVSVPVFCSLSGLHIVQVLLSVTLSRSAPPCLDQFSWGGGMTTGALQDASTTNYALNKWARLSVSALYQGTFVLSLTFSPWTWTQTLKWQRNQ